MPGEQADETYDEISRSSFRPYDPQSEVAGASEEVSSEPDVGFDPRWRQPFVGLTYLGRLESHFSLWGHEIVIRTLSTDDHAQVGMICEPYEATRAKSAVYQTAVVAASVVSVDGRPLVRSLSAEESDLTARYRYVSKQWAPAIREKVWEKVFELEDLVREVLEEMGKDPG